MLFWDVLATRGLQIETVLCICKTVGLAVHFGLEINHLVAKGVAKVPMAGVSQLSFYTCRANFPQIKKKSTTKLLLSPNFWSESLKYFLWYRKADEQAGHLIVRDYRHP